MNIFICKFKFEIAIQNLPSSFKLSVSCIASGSFICWAIGEAKLQYKKIKTRGKKKEAHHYRRTQSEVGWIWGVEGQL